jgi:2-amino-4-hydroxy-6-hydroxymethyldihydropteridine diphosphokinase
VKQPPQTVSDVYLGLGSNLGRRERNITAALSAIESTRGLEVAMVSGLYETEPVGGPADQPPYLNAVARIRTTLTPPRVLALCHRIEQSLGRRRDAVWGPRTIDLDILLFADEIVSSVDLTIPHPMMHDRRFVLEPLAEIAPDLVHPVLQQTIRELLDALPAAV